MMTLDEIAALTGVEMVADEEAQGRRLEVVAALCRDLQSATDAQQRADVIRELLEDEPRMLALDALSLDRQAWMAATLRIRAIRGCGGPMADLDRLLKGRRAGAADLRVVQEDEREPLPDPLPAGYRIPSGWMVSRRGVYAVQVSEQHGEVARHVSEGPLYVTGRLVDADTGAHQLQLAWYGDHGEWVERVVARRTAADARGLVDLAGDGAPVTSQNAGDLVRYIAASAATNARVLPGRLSLGRCGWADGGFMLGDEWIGDQRQPRVFHAEAGLAQIAAGFTVGGEWDGWAGTIGEVHDLPYPHLAVWGAVASILLQPLGQRMGFLLDFSGETSTGKSSIIEAGLSVAGPPRGPTFGTWGARLPGIEALLYTAHHLPIALDDTKQAERPELISDVIYMAVNGVGKLRGAPSGKSTPVAMRLTARWLSGVLVTGEQRATAYSRDEGAAARTISLQGMPFGGKGPAFRRRAKALTRGVAQHHGHLIRRVIPWLIDGGIATAQGWLDEETDRYTEPLAAIGGVQGRLGETLALLATASRVCEAVGAPMPSCDPLAEAYRACAGAGEDADQARVALDRLYALASARAGSFMQRHTTDAQERDEQPSGGWLGFWSAQTPDWTSLMMFPNVVEDELRRNGFEIDAITKAWADRGWIDCNHGRRHRFKRNGRKIVVYRFLREALEAE